MVGPAVHMLVRRAWRLGLAAAALSCASVADAIPKAGAEGAARAEPAVVSTGRPAGFETFFQPQEVVADVIVGGRLAGQARVRYSAGKVTLLDVDAVMAIMPDVVDVAAVRAALAAPDLDSHSGMVCQGETDAERALCPVYRPGVAGVVFDAARFRLDVMVAARLMAVHPVAARAYLPKPQRGLSLVDRFGGSVAGSGRYLSYGLQNRAILASGDARIRSDLSYSSTYGVQVDALAGELDRPGIRYTAGVLWVPGIELIGRRRLLGAGIQSQVDTRLDRTALAGTPLIVSLTQHARVDILRDGRLLTSRSYDAGNRALDTTSLPDGAYEVVLHIQEAGGPARDERRFFTKNAAIAGIGEPIFFAYGGLLGRDTRHAPLATTGTPLLLAGIARRYTPHLALDATVMGTNRTGILEVGGYWLTAAAQARVAALASVHGDAGLLFQAYSSGAARINYTVDARRVWSRSGAPLIPLGEPDRGYDIVQLDRTAQLSVGSFTQVNATISYNLKPGQIGVTAAYRRAPTEGRTYAVGPTIYWPLVQRAGVQVNLRADMTLSNHGGSAFVGLTFQRLRAHSAISGSLGARTITGAGEGTGTAVIGDIGGSWQRDHVLGGDATIAAGAEQDVGGTLLRGRAELNAARASVFADVAQPVAGDLGTTQYSLDFQTTAAVTRAGLAFEGHAQNDGGIRIAVMGAARGTPFEVLIDNAPRGTVRVGTPLSIAVAPYRQYAVRLRSTGGDIMMFDGGARMVTVYPGNVSRLAWSATRVVAMFGRLLWSDGSAVRHAAVQAPGAIGGTDEQGYFQIEAGADAVLKVRAPDGRSCQVTLDAHAGPGGYAPLGTLICVRPLPATQFANAQ